MANRLATRADVCGPLGTPGGVAPALNDATDEQVELALEQARELVWIKRYRGLTSFAQAYLAAHLLATAPTPAPGGGVIPPLMGPVTGMSDGPASWSFGSAASDPVPGSDADYQRTEYGRRYLYWREKQRGFGSVLVSGGQFPY